MASKHPLEDQLTGSTPTPTQAPVTVDSVHLTALLRPSCSFADKTIPKLKALTEKDGELTATERATAKEALEALETLCRIGKGLA